MIGLLLATVLTTGNVVPEKADTSIFKTEDIQEVVISETKFNKRNLTPVAKSLASRQLIEQQQIFSIRELTGLLPNFYMPENGARSSTPIYIRGIGIKSKGTAVSFYVDDVPIEEAYAFDMNVSDVKNVEILRGPQGTLFGRNSIGGTVSISNLNPLDHQGILAKIGYGSYNDQLAQFWISQAITSNFGVRASASYHHNDGYFTNSYFGEKADDMNEGNGDIGLYWRLKNNWQLRLTSSLNMSNQGGYPYAVYDVETRQVGDISFNRYSPYKRLVSTNGFNIRHDGEKVSLSSQTSFVYIKTHQGLDQDYTTEDRYWLNSNYRQNMLTEEITARSNHNGRYQWVTGVFGRLYYSNHLSDLSTFTANKETFTTSKEPQQSFAVYHQSSYNIWKGLSATVGLRFDYEHAKIDYWRDKLNLKINEQSHETDFLYKDEYMQITPKFTLQYLTDKKNLYYASVTRGYRPGGFNNVLVEEDNRSYDAEYSWNYETGLRLNFLEGKLTAEADLFYIDWRDMQSATHISGVGNITANAGHADSKGFEISLSARPIRNLSLLLNYGYTYARYLSYVKNEKTDYSGNYIPLAPRNTLGFAANYTIVPAGWLDRIDIRAGVNALGRIYWAEDNEVYQNFYAVANANVSVTKGIVSFGLWSKNLTNTDYMSYSFKGTYAGQLVQKARPFTIGASLTIKI